MVGRVMLTDEQANQIIKEYQFWIDVWNGVLDNMDDINKSGVPYAEHKQSANRIVEKAEIIIEEAVSRIEWSKHINRYFIEKYQVRICNVDELIEFELDQLETKTDIQLRDFHGTIHYQQMKKINKAMNQILNEIELF